MVSLCQSSGLDEYPEDLWKNVKLQGKSYEDRVCCEVGTNSLSEQCPKLDDVRDIKISDEAIFGIIFGFLIIVELVGCYFCYYYKRRGNRVNRKLGMRS